MTLRLIFQDWIWSRYSNVEFENDEKVLDECWQWIGQAEPTNQGESQKHREDQSIRGGRVPFSWGKNRIKVYKEEQYFSQETET